MAYTTSLSVRPASTQDYPAIYQFVCELQGKTFDESELFVLYQQNIENRNNLYLIALSGTKPVGYASCHVQALLHHGGKVAEIQEMFVLSEYRNSGVGKLLMNEVKKKVKEMGALQLEVTTRKIREKAIQFYLRENFENSHQKLVYQYDK